MKNDIMGVSRLRMGTDGKGITTLVTFYGCPLACIYCLNPHCSHKDTLRADYTPEELLEVVKIDDIYFQMTGGGVTFGGGEPLLYGGFIREFCRIANPQWKIRIETSLNIGWEMAKCLIEYVDLWIIDIKDMDVNIYRRYTGKGNELVIQNLTRLKNMVTQSQLLLRVPLIPDYNTEYDIEKSMEILKDFEHIERIKYII